jgi:hypothetical protein
MTITTTTLTRAAGLAAVAGGLLYIGVQVNHPNVDLTLVTTTEWKVRQTMKVLFAALSLAGITGMYLRQVKKTGVLGLLGYVLFATGFLVMMSIEFAGAVVLPAIAHDAPGYVSDVLAAATVGTATGDIGLMTTANMLVAVTFLGGGLLFAIALFRGNILARWAAVLLAVGSLVPLAIPLLPQVNYRLFALPTGVAMVCLGFSLWREQRSRVTSPTTSSVSPRLHPTAVK